MSSSFWDTNIVFNPTTEQPICKLISVQLFLTEATEGHRQDRGSSSVLFDDIEDLCQLTSWQIHWWQLVSRKIQVSETSTHSVTKLWFSSKRNSYHIFKIEDWGSSKWILKENTQVQAFGRCRQSQASYLKDRLVVTSGRGPRLEQQHRFAHWDTGKDRMNLCFDLFTGTCGIFNTCVWNEYMCVYICLFCSS